ncbi:MAG TPA: protein translocase subunit SecD [Gammaproteobacteria bacterium]|nr:protein translocase subunit SecD [Gammaproteobacteria bacterium]
MNRYPMWVNVLTVLILVVSTILALPNVYGEDPAIQVSTATGTAIDAPTLESIRAAIEKEDIGIVSADIENNAALVRFPTVAAQLEAQDVLRGAFPNHVIALTLAPRTPEWMSALGLKPMSLGLDLRGGVHFLYQVDLDTAIRTYLTTEEADLRRDLREAGVRNRLRVQNNALLVEVLDSADLAKAESVIRKLESSGVGIGQQGLIVSPTQIGGNPGFRVQLSDALIKQRQDFAIQQNIVTLRNRVNELGVSEALVQRQGLDRILVELPGIQDPAQAERVLGATSTLEFRLVDTEANAAQAAAQGHAPVGDELYYTREGVPYVLKREPVATGDQLVDANSGYTQGQPSVNVRLNAQGARRMLDTTTANLNKPMAVLLIEEKPQTVERDGKQVVETKTEKTIINVATIRGVFSSNFQITGLSPFEARDLALMLRSGALSTPIVKVEERTIGPSLGQDNIVKGRNAVVVGFLAVVLFMALYYRVFGLIADIALAMNVVVIIAALAIINSALTLPGIAGIVLTVGMSVDANVLIFERIREELRLGSSPQASIRAGYEKAWATIFDSHITTLIAALVLFFFGTGPIKGFAVTLSIGIISSIYTAVVGTRVIVNLMYGGRTQIKRLPIGGIGRMQNASA